MGTYGPQAASLQEHPHSPTCSAVLKPKPEPLSLSKPEAQQQSLQIDCRAEHSQPGYYHTFPADQISSRDQRAAGMLQEDASRESRGDTAQEPTCSHDSSRLQECQSPLSTQSHDKRCSQCGATKTPMWRNDTQGNKTLCNACGVRLQRQLNKQKQQNQAVAEKPTSLIAGKLPRSRTSPAKLLKHDLPRTSSQDIIRHLENNAINKPASRSLTLIHNASGQPTLTIAPAPPKRKGLESAMAHSSVQEERKRLCNEGGGSRSQEAAIDIAVPTDLLIPNGRAPNCIVRLELPRTTAQGTSGGRLRVYTALGRLAASCSSPGLEEALRYSVAHHAWIWAASPQWSLLFASEETCSQFEELLRRWRKSRQLDVGLGWTVYRNQFKELLQDQEGRDVLAQSPNLSNVGSAGSSFTSPPGIEMDDRKFLDHINAKILKEANGNHDGSNPKALNATLADDTFLRLLGAFEFFLQRTQGFAEANVIQLSVNLDWTPNRAVILAVHRYWVGKLYRHKRWLDFGKATNGSNQSGSMSRSFSASPPMPSTRSDISALTLEDYALSQHRAPSEETSDDGQPSSAFAPEVSNLPKNLTGFASMPNFALPQLPQAVGPDLRVGSGLLSQPWLSSSCLSPTSCFALASGPLPSSHQPAEEWDPLDPSNLARIADPNQDISTFETRKSTTQAGLEVRGDHPDQCMSMKEMGNRKGLGSSDPLQGLHLDSLGDGLPQNTDRQQMVDFLDAASLMQPDDSGQDLGLARHCHHSNSGVDLSSLRQHLYSTSFSGIQGRLFPQQQSPSTKTTGRELCMVGKVDAAASCDFHQ